MEKGQIGILLSKFLDKMRLGVAPDCVFSVHGVID